MDFTNYFNDLPLELELSGKVDELKLLYLYAYNAYFNADVINTDKLKDSICFNRVNNSFGIDGVFLNMTMEDNTVELVFSYFVGNNAFSLMKATNAISIMSGQLTDVAHHKYISSNPLSDSLLKDLLEQFDDEKKVVILRVITDYVPTEQEKYQWSKIVESFEVKIKDYEVSAKITFGDDILMDIESNKAPFDYVEQDRLVVDNPDNVLKYGDDSFICNISAKSLKQLWAKEGQRGLLAMNLRYYVKNKNIDQKIEDSLTTDGDNFWYLNNGIIVVCDNYNFVGNELRMEHFSIVNGGQTTRMIGTIPFDNDFYVSCKVIKNTFETSNDKNMFIAKVAEASNTQKPIKSKDIIANKIEQRNLKTQLQEGNIFIEIKRGEKFNHDIFKEAWQRTKNNELAQDLYSFVYMEPGPSRNNVSSILQSEEKYATIFQEHKYCFDFLRDVIFLEKAFREFTKITNKAENEDAVRKGLVKNGLFYILATVGYLVKMAYNPEYKNNVLKYRNNDALFNIYSPEQAFDHGFIQRNLSYKQFVTKSFDLFHYVLTNIIIPQYQTDKASNPNLVYSNWTKTNTAFNSIRRTINAKIFDAKDETWLDYIRAFFAKVDDDQINANIDAYVDLCKRHKVESKDSEGNVLTIDEEALRDELLTYRLNRAKSAHIYDEKVFKLTVLDRLVYEKPATMAELKKIVGPTSAAMFGMEIIGIISKYI